MNLVKKWMTTTTQLSLQTIDKNDDTTHSVGGDLPSAFGPSSHKTIAGVELPHLLRTVDAPTDTKQDGSFQGK